MESDIIEVAPQHGKEGPFVQKITLVFILLFLITLTACSGSAPTPAPETALTPTPESIAATAPPPANTPEPTATTAHTPAISSTPTPRALSPVPIEDRGAVLSSLSDAELACIGGDPEKMIAALTGGAPTSMQEQARLVGCLDDDTVDLIFMATNIPVPLSAETSDCVLAALDVIDPRVVITAGLEGDPGTAMAGSMAAFTVSVACLNEEEWAAAAPRVGMVPEDRDGMVCIMAALGGPTEMATAMTEAMEAEEVGEDTALFMAGLECGMEPGPAPGQASTEPTPTPMPTATTVPTLTQLSSAESEASGPASSTAEPVPQNTGSGGAGAVEHEDGETPLPEGVSPALVQDAQMYAEQYGVELGEAVTRLMLQEPAGKLGAALREHEVDTFAGLWIQHEPEFAIIVVFTRDGQETVRQYIQDGPLEELVKVRHAKATLRELMNAQAEANRIVTQAGFRVASGINVFENRVELYADNPAQLAEAIEENGLALPAHVLIIGH